MYVIKYTYANFFPVLLSFMTLDLWFFLSNLEILGLKVSLKIYVQDAFSNDIGVQ